MPEVRRFHSPFAHWVSGLATEIVVFAAFIGICALAAFALTVLF